VDCGWFGERLDYTGLQALASSEIPYDCFILALRTIQLTIVYLEAIGTKLWRAVFKSDYSSVYVLDCNNQEVISEFPLMD
jgi:hypothetical protein